MTRQEAEQYRQPELNLMSTPEIQIVPLWASPLCEAAAARSRESLRVPGSSWWTSAGEGSDGRAASASGDELMPMMMLPFPQTWSFILISLFLLGCNWRELCELGDHGWTFSTNYPQKTKPSIHLSYDSSSY